ncbi:MAG: DMT family transporter [Lachnospiraceae bacterium]|nr:DMT family transporter [Lachnospiraceae bacterium]
MKRSAVTGSLILLLTAAVWGVSFVAQSASMEYIGPFTFSAVRCMMGTIVLIPVIIGVRVFLLRDPAKYGDSVFVHVFDRNTVMGGLLSGLLLFIASNLQTIALKTASAGKAGFITAMYIVMVPLFGLFLNKRVGLNVWISVLLAAVGLYLLCMKDALGFGTDDLLLLACAVFFAIQILVVDKYVPFANGIAMAAIEFFVCSVLSAVVMFAIETPEWPLIRECMGALLYAGIGSCGVAYTLQIIGQRFVEPATASLIMSLESVISAISGAVILHQMMSGREIAGCALMFAAIILAQLVFKGKTD